MTRTFEQPPEPDDIETLIDKYDIIWHRNRIPGGLHWKSEGGVERSWRELLHYNSPLEEYVKPPTLYNVIYEGIEHKQDPIIYGRSVCLKDAQYLINHIFEISPKETVQEYVRDKTITRKWNVGTFKYTIEEIK